VRKTILSLFTCAALGATPPVWADSVDAKLLGMLRDNGSITAEQYAELSADLTREQRAVARESVDKEEFVDLQQKIAWAAKTVISGDVRARQEHVTLQHSDPDPNKDRQRIRARLAVVSQVTPTVEAGIRVATGSSNDARSTNQDLDSYFTKKDLWLDRAYINWHPTSVSGLKLFAGKIAQPWLSMGEMIWDSDINPEGVAAVYSRKFGDTELFGTGGAFTLKNNVDGEGNEFQNDLRLQMAQVGVRMFPGDSFKVTLGGSVYHYYNDAYGTAGLELNGNTTTQFQLYEGFGQLDVLGLPVPLSLYGQYARNTAANGPQDDKDKAWLAGFTTRIWEIGVNYNYRDVERNSVVGAFTDSDFANGFTASRGSKLSLLYNITNNFVLTTSYFDAVSNAASTQPGSNVDTLQVDLQAVF
jgi:Putative porin